MSTQVTVGIALYNHEDYIEQCIRSVLAQDYANIELIIIDDGSSDNSYRVAQTVLNESQSSRAVRISTRANKGMCNTLNEIARHASGGYISFIGSDDYWLPNKISDQVAYLDANPDDALVHSNSHRVDSHGNFLRAMDYSTKDNSGHLFESMIKRTGGINTPSHLYRTSVYDVIGYYDPAFRFEDTDFWLRLTKQYTVGFINQYHTFYRWHDDNLSNQSNKLKFYLDELIAIYQKNIDDPALRRYATRRVCTKGILRSIKAAEFSLMRKFMAKWIQA